MKSYWISRYQLRWGVVGSIIALILFIIGLYSAYLFIAGNHEIWFFAISALLIPLFTLYRCLPTYRFGKFSVDRTGITMHIWRKCWTISWEEVQECDMWVMVQGGRNVWVYFSTRHLEDGECILCFNRKWDDLGKVAFFQYSARDFQEILNTIPPRFSRELQTKQKYLDGYLKWPEKVRHR